MKVLFLSDEGNIEQLEVDNLTQGQLEEADGNGGSIIRWNEKDKRFEEAIIHSEEEEVEDEDDEPEVVYDITGWSEV